MPRRPTRSRNTNRPTKRRLNSRLDSIDGDSDANLPTALWADLKDYYGARLTPSERRARRRFIEDSDAD